MPSGLSMTRMPEIRLLDCPTKCSLAFGLDFVEQLFDAKALLDRFIIIERKFRNTLQMLEPLTEGMTDIAGSRSKPLNRFFMLFFVPECTDKNSRVSKIR